MTKLGTTQREKGLPVPLKGRWLRRHARLHELHLDSRQLDYVPVLQRLRGRTQVGAVHVREHFAFNVHNEKASWAAGDDRDLILRTTDDGRHLGKKSTTLRAAIVSAKRNERICAAQPKSRTSDSQRGLWRGRDLFIKDGSERGKTGWLFPDKAAHVLDGHFRSLRQEFQHATQVPTSSVEVTGERQ